MLHQDGKSKLKFWCPNRHNHQVTQELCMPSALKEKEHAHTPKNWRGYVHLYWMTLLLGPALQLPPAFFSLIVLVPHDWICQKTYFLVLWPFLAAGLHNHGVGGSGMFTGWTTRMPWVADKKMEKEFKNLELTGFEVKSPPLQALRLARPQFHIDVIFSTVSTRCLWFRFLLLLLFLLALLLNLGISNRCLCHSACLLLVCKCSFLNRPRWICFHQYSLVSR